MYRSSFLTSTLDGNDLSASSPSRFILWEPRPPPTQLEDEWAPYLIWMLQERETSLFPTGNQSMIPAKGTRVKRNTFYSLLNSRVQFKEKIYSYIN